METDQLVTRTAIYSRYSVDNDSADLSHDRQTSTCRTRAAQLGFVVVDVYSDSITGMASDRPEWGRLLADAKAGRFDRVLVYRLDRIGRSLRVSLNLLHELTESGVGVMSVIDNIDMGGPMGALMRNVILLMADAERETMLQRTTSGSRAKAARGEPPGGELPFGWKRDVLGAIVPDVRERQVLTTAADCVLAGGSTGDAANLLAGLGLVGRRGTVLSHNRVLRLLRAKSLVGVMTYGDPTKRVTSHATRVDRHGKPVWGDPIEIQLPDPVMDEATWERLQRALDVKAYGKKADSKPYPLSTPITQCWCGAPMSGTASRGRRVYRCRDSKWRPENDPAPRCPQPRIDALSFEQLVWATVVKQLSSFRLVQRAIAARLDAAGVKSVDGAQDELDHVQHVIRVIKDAQSDTVAALFRSGVVEADVIESAVAQSNAELDALRAREAQLVKLATPMASGGQSEVFIALMVRVFKSLNPKTPPPPELLGRVLTELRAKVTLLEQSAPKTLPKVSIELTPNVAALVALVQGLGIDNFQLTEEERRSFIPPTRTRTAYVLMDDGTYGPTQVRADTEAEFEAGCKELGAVTVLPDDGDLAIQAVPHRELRQR